MLFLSLRWREGSKMSFRSSAGLFPVLYRTTPLRVRLAGLSGAAGVALRTVLTRRELDELDDRVLADIGLSRGEAEKEARRAPWDLGPTRRFPRRLAPHRPGGMDALRTRLREMFRRRRSRRAISGLDRHMLKDIGISYAEAEFEANKPAWRP